MKKNLTAVIVFCVAAAVVVGAQMFSRPVCGLDMAARKSAEPAGNEPASDSAMPPMSLPVQVAAYYFHGNFRCATCARIEQYSREAIESGFAEQLRTGVLVFKVINIEKPESEHFVQAYQLYTKSLVLSLVKDGKEVRYKNLDKVWEYVRDRGRFQTYVQGEVAQFLEGLK